MKRSLESGDDGSNFGLSQQSKKQKIYPVLGILDQISNNPGLQHIIEKIFLNLDFDSLLACQLINKSCQEVLDDPIFWLKKWILRGLSKKNQTDWTKAVLLLRNTKLKTNLNIYLKRILKKKVFLDIPCYIDEEIFEFSESTIPRQELYGIIEFVKSKNIKGIQMLSFFKTDKFMDHFVWPTFMIFAAVYNNLEAIQVLAPLTSNNPNDPDENGITPIYKAAELGCNEVIKYLAPLTDNPNAPTYDGSTPIQIASQHRHFESVRILQSYN